jgi:hypothetical protein
LGFWGAWARSTFSFPLSVAAKHSCACALKCCRAPRRISGSAKRRCAKSSRAAASARSGVRSSEVSGAPPGVRGRG